MLKGGSAQRSIRLSAGKRQCRDRAENNFATMRCCARAVPLRTVNEKLRLGYAMIVTQASKTRAIATTRGSRPPRLEESRRQISAPASDVCPPTAMAGDHPHSVQANVRRFFVAVATSRASRRSRNIFVSACIKNSDHPPARFNYSSYLFWLKRLTYSPPSKDARVIRL